MSLKNKGLILYPTDTIWGIGCDATDFDVVQKVYQLKNRATNKSLIVLVSSIEMLENYVAKIPSEIVKLLHSEETPITVIYNNPKNIAANCIADDQTVAIRIVSEGFAHQLIKQFGKPIVSTSANVSGEPFPKKFSEISTTILKGVDYIVALHDKKMAHSTSKIVRINAQGNIKVIRY